MFTMWEHERAVRQVTFSRQNNVHVNVNDLLNVRFVQAQFWCDGYRLISLNLKTTKQVLVKS